MSSRIAVLAASAAIAIGIVPVHRALACTVVQRPQAALDAEADLVFTGTAVRADMPGILASTQAEVVWTFQVDAVERGGRQQDRIRVASAASGSSCGFEFELGQRYRVLADRRPEPLPPSTGLGSGNQQLEDAAGRVSVEGEFYAVTLSVPLPVLLGAPPVIAGGVLIGLVLLLRRYVPALRGRSDPPERASSRGGPAD